MELAPAGRTVPVASTRPGGLDATLFATLPDAVLYASYPERRILDANPACLELFGFAKELALASTTQLIHLDREHFVRFGELVAPSLARGEPLTLEYPLRRADGSTFVAQVTITPQANATGDVVGLVGVLRDLTRQKELEAELSEQTKRYETLVQAQSELGDAVVLLGPRGILWANDAFADLVGLTREEVTSPAFDFQRLVPPEEAHEFRAREQQRLSGDASVQHYRIRLRHRDGELIPVEVSSKPQRAGADFRIVSVLRDLRPRLAAESELRLHSKVLESMTEGVTLSTQEGIIVYTNPAEDAMFGYAKGELIGQPVTIQNAYAPGENERIVATVIGELRERGHWEGEFKNRRKDGTTFTTYARIARLEIDGQPHWVCVQEDITARAKQAEALRASEARFRALADTALDAIVTADRAGRIVFANPAAGRMFGYAEGALAGRAVSEIMPPSYREGHLAGLARSARTGESRLSGRVLDLEGLRSDGTVFPIELSLTHWQSAGETYFAATMRDVTERTRARRELEKTTRTLQDFVETSAIGLHWVGPNGTILWANAADHELLGYAREEYIGRDIREFHVDREVIEDILARLTRDERLHEYPARLKAKDGTIRHVVIDSSVYREEGRFIHTRCFTRDVTAQHLAEQKERENARTLKTLLRVQEELASNLDLKRVVQAATDAATLLSGAAFGAFFYNVLDEKGESYMLYTLSGVAPEAFSKFPMPRNTAVFAPTFRGDGIVRSDDITADARYGKNPPHTGMPKGHLPVRSYLAVPVKSPQGTVHGGIFLGHPGKAQFSAEAERLVAAIAAQTATALDNATLYQRARESEARLADIVKNAPAQIITVDGEGRLLSTNRSLRAIEPAELVGTSIYEMVVEDDRARVRSIIEGVMTTSEPAEYETRALIAGEERWFHVRVAPAHRPGRSGAILIVTDVSQRKKDESELALIRAQLLRGEKLAALGGLVSGLAHELRTPLTFLANNAFLLKIRIEKAAASGADAATVARDATPYLREIGGAVDRIDQLVEDLRRYTRAGSDAAFVQAPLHTVVADVIEIFRATNRHAHVVETSLAPTGEAKLNRGAIQQVALNLLQNAAEASAAGGVIHVLTRDEPGSCVLEVIDHGHGIPPEVMEQMYNPMFTTKPEGSGLGLAIVKRIVEEHKGRIDCETTPGKGTRFIVTIPKG